MRGYTRRKVKISRSCEIEPLLKTHICKLGVTIPSRVHIYGDRFVMYLVYTYEYDWMLKRAHCCTRSSESGVGQSHKQGDEA